MSYKIGDVLVHKASKAKYTIKANHKDLWLFERHDGVVLSFYTPFLTEHLEPYVEPKKKVVLTEFLYLSPCNSFAQTRWATSKEDAEKVCEKRNNKFLQWGLREVEVESESL